MLIIIEVCPKEPRASACTTDGDPIKGSEYEQDMFECTTSGDNSEACEHILDVIGVDFRIIALGAGGKFENRPATAAEKRATCEAIYFESESDFSDEKIVERYLVWEAAADFE